MALGKATKFFAASFNKYRKRKKLTYKELKLTVGISESQLCEIAKGKRSVNFETAVKISKAVGFSLDDLKEVL